MELYSRILFDKTVGNRLTCSKLIKKDIELEFFKRQNGKSFSSEAWFCQVGSNNYYPASFRFAHIAVEMKLLGQLSTHNNK